MNIFLSDFTPVEKPSDVLLYLCKVEFQLRVCLAYQRTGIYQERAEPTEPTYLEDCVASAGNAFGRFLSELKDCNIPLYQSDNSALDTLLRNIVRLGQQLSADLPLWCNQPFWQVAVARGVTECEADKALCEADIAL